MVIPNEQSWLLALSKIFIWMVTLFVSYCAIQLHWSSNVLVKLLLYIVFTLIISSNVQQEGLVEIREDCVEETSYGESAASGKFSFDFNCYIGNSYYS